MKALLAPKFVLSKLKNHISGRNVPAYQRFSARSHEWLCHTKKRVVAIDHRKEIPNRKVGSWINGNCPGSSGPLGHLGNRFYTHVCEATRSKSGSQVLILQRLGQAHGPRQPAVPYGFRRQAHPAKISPGK